MAVALMQMVNANVNGNEVNISNTSIVVVSHHVVQTAFKNLVLCCFKDKVALATSGRYLSRHCITELDTLGLK